MGSNVIIRALTLGLSALKEKQMFFISSDSVLNHLDPVKHVSCQVRMENFQRSPDHPGSADLTLPWD